MTLASDITADLAGIFLTDFAVTVTATTWGTTPLAIFDQDYVELNAVSSVMPFLLMRDADIPDTYASADLFTVNGSAYQLVDVQYAEPEMSRVILARV
jgi:hypothetical protein